jgi:hypothetical protein
MTLHLSAEELVVRNRQKQREWRAAHPERVRHFYLKYAASGKDKPRKAAWSRDNKERVNLRRRELYRERHPVTTAFVDRPTYFSSDKEREDAEHHRDPECGAEPVC